jgi:hypothetical protein
VRLKEVELAVSASMLAVSDHSEEPLEQSAYVWLRNRHDEEMKNNTVARE